MDRIYIYIYIYIYSSYKVQQPDALQHDGMTSSETEIEMHTTLRGRQLGGSQLAVLLNSQSSKWKTVQKLTRTC